MNLKEYASYKTEMYAKGDKGAFGDLYEVLVKSMLYKNFTDEMVHVAAQGKADFYSREGSYEIGHNGKSWFFRDEYNRIRHPRKVVYGMVTDEEMNEIASLIVNDMLTAAQTAIANCTAIFSSEDEYIEVMENLTRGKGLKVAHTVARGDLTMTIYNESKRKAFLRALNEGKLQRFEGRA